MFVVDLEVNQLLWGKLAKPKRLHLTNQQAEVLSVLRERMGGRVAYETIIYRIYGMTDTRVDARSVISTLVCRLKAALRDNEIPAVISSIRDVGYELKTDLAEPNDKFLMDCLKHRARVEQYLRRIRDERLMERAA